MTQNSLHASDASLRAAILGLFSAEDSGVFSSLRVGVLNGIAHLAGTVPSLESYIAAAELVESIPGIRGVVNRIEAPGAPSPSRSIHLHLQREASKESEGDAI